MSSITTVAPSSVPKFKATTVISPNSELRRACRVSTRHGRTPLARAVTT